jgi:hypothetical protein
MSLVRRVAGSQQGFLLEANMPIAFTSVGTFSGAPNNPTVLNNPTSLQFGPDERLYVSEQNGDINAFSVEKQADGSWAATSVEVLQLADGSGVVKSIQNHNDDGTEASTSNRQVTGIVVTEDDQGNIVLYVSSSDPRISSNNDVGLDTNSGVVSKVTQTETGVGGGRSRPWPATIRGEPFRQRHDPQRGRNQAAAAGRAASPTMAHRRASSPTPTNMRSQARRWSSTW